MNFLSYSPQLQHSLKALGMAIFHSFWQGLLLMSLKKFDAEKEVAFESNLHVFPNPGRDQLKVTFTLREAAPVEFELLDKGGSALTSFEYHFSSAGKQEITIPTDRFPLDSCILRAKLNGKFENVRVVLK